MIGTTQFPVKLFATFCDIIRSIQCIQAFFPWAQAGSTERHLSEPLNIITSLRPYICQRTQCFNKKQTDSGKGIVTGARFVIGQRGKCRQRATDTAQLTFMCTHTLVTHLTEFQTGTMQFLKDVSLQQSENCSQLCEEITEVKNELKA